MHCAEMEAFCAAAKALYEAFMCAGDSPKLAATKLRNALSIGAEFLTVNSAGRMHYGQPCAGEGCAICEAMTKKVAHA